MPIVSERAKRRDGSRVVSLAQVWRLCSCQGQHTINLFARDTQLCRRLVVLQLLHAGNDGLKAIQKNHTVICH